MIKQFHQHAEKVPPSSSSVYPHSQTKEISLVSLFAAAFFFSMHTQTQTDAKVVLIKFHFSPYRHKWGTRSVKGRKRGRARNFSLSLLAIRLLALFSISESVPRWCFNSPISPKRERGKRSKIELDNSSECYALLMAIAHFPAAGDEILCSFQLFE
jgi:hypothetical protein